MQVYRFREKRSGDRPYVVTIGNFDGMHLGHQALTGAVVNEAKDRDLSSALVTFHPHPQEILHPRRPVQRICTQQLQNRLFQDSGIDEVHVIPFTPELAELDADTFASRYLLQRFNLEKLIIGYDFRFGKNRTGDFILLERLGQENGFALEEIAPFRIKNQIVSSTLIRKGLKKGEAMGLAGKGLLHPAVAQYLDAIDGRAPPEPDVEDPCAAHDEATCGATDGCDLCLCFF